MRYFIQLIVVVTTQVKIYIQPLNLLENTVHVDKRNNNRCDELIAHAVFPLTMRCVTGRRTSVDLGTDILCVIPSTLAAGCTLRVLDLAGALKLGPLNWLQKSR